MSTTTLDSTTSRPTSPRTPISTAPSRVARRSVDPRRYRRQGRRRLLRADALTVVAWVSVAVAVALFLASGGLAKITDVASFLTQLGVVTGLAATDLCVLMLLLTARIPVVDRAIGLDRATEAHGKLGAWVVIGLLLHALLLIVGNGLADGGVLAEFIGYLAIPDLLFAVVALAGLILVGISSYHVAKRSLGHEAWHAIHLLTYVAVAASVPHQFSQGLLATPGVQRWYWATLWLATAASILGWRVLRPLITSARHRFRVEAVIPAGRDAVTIVMRGRRVQELGIAAGQFFQFRFLDRHLWWQHHPFSVSAAPAGDLIRITVRDLGAGTHAMQRVRPGTAVMVEGPYGLFSDEARTTARGVVLAGAGIGIAPIRAILEETDTQGPTTVILRAHDESELYLVDEVAHLARRRGAALHVVVGPRDRSPHGVSWLPATWRGARLSTLAPQLSDSDVFVCGPTGWAEAVMADARAAGVAPTRLHNERFSW